MWRKLKQFDIESIEIEPKEIKKKNFFMNINLHKFYLFFFINSNNLTLSIPRSPY